MNNKEFVLNNNYSTIEFRDKLYDDIRVTSRDSVILMCAIFIASIGLNMNSTAVIIGAMLISPLMTPIVGLGLGMALFDTKLFRQSFTLLTAQVFISLSVSTVYFWLSPISYASSELTARTSPTIWDVLIAIAGGIAGVIGSRKREANNIVPGVAIATALMPPVCTAGYGLANGNLDFFLGAMYLFLINFVFIMLSNFIGSIILMNQSVVSFIKGLDKKIRGFFFVIITLLVVPAIYSASLLVFDYAQKDSINKFIENEFKDQTIIDNVFNKDNQSLELTIVGARLSEDELSKIKENQKNYGLELINVKVNQVVDIPSNSNENIQEIYNYINRYVDNKLSGTDLKNESVNEDKN